jgi:hypothetical protein|nr:MAG TPA: hypothetical protein [Caudoviricetes sp.]DAT58787.1 MAG TPA: hypothetical protein [Bacteriophage sp.]
MGIILSAKEAKEKSEFMLNVNLLIFSTIWNNIDATEVEFEGDPSAKELEWISELGLKIKNNKLIWG